MSALKGNLRDFGIAEVFQLIGQQRKTGVLEFLRRGRRVELRFDRGAVVSAAPVGARPDAALGEMLVRCGLMTRERVDRLLSDCEASAQSFGAVAVARGWLDEEALAEIEGLLTRETIFAVMSWNAGSFDFTASPVPHERPPETLLAAEQILMDGLRMVDEWQSFAELVPSEDLVFRRVGSFDDYRERARHESGRRIDSAERVFFLIDGRLSVRRVIDLSRLGTFDATRILADLRRAGAIEPVATAGESRLRRTRQAVGLDRAQLRGWLAALVPMLALALITAAAFRSGGGAGLRAHALERAPLASAIDSHAARRVRHALEAWRLTHGAYPEALPRLRDAGLLEEGALAASRARPYYYARREDGALLLAPER